MQVVARIAVPEKENADWSDMELGLALVAVVPDASEELADLSLLLRAIGRPELDLVAETLSVKLKLARQENCP